MPKIYLPNKLSRNLKYFTMKIHSYSAQINSKPNTIKYNGMNIAENVESVLILKVAY